MTKWRCAVATGWLSLVILVFAATAQAATPAPLAEQIAKTYGIDSYDKIEAIRFTFNAQLPGVNVSRSWVWQPKTGQVSYEGKDTNGQPVKVTYVQSQLAGAPANVRDQIDPWFINDQYNLLFPFHVYWDGAVVRDGGMQKLPLGDGSARQVVVDYSPGDIWELYVGPDNRVVQFAFHRGGSQKPSVVLATWDGYKQAGPLLVATGRHGTADGKPLEVSFTNVAVKLAGSDNWVNAQ